MPTLTAAPLSQVRPGPGLRWLWPNYLPRGKLALLDGDPGVGKSLLAIDLAARLSRGAPLPDGTPAGRPHTTLYLSAEDDAADTTRPRAEAAGADLGRIVAATAGPPLSFPAQIPDLEELIRAHAADLVVIDPLMAFLPPEVAANSDPCVRRGLTPLAALAARTDCAILLIRHLRKLAAAKALHRGLGSVGIIAAVRTGWLAARHPTDPGLGVLAVTKANLAGEVPSLGYRIKSGPLAPRAGCEPTARGASGPLSGPCEDGGAAVVEWAGPAEVTADGLGTLPPAPLRPRDRAAEWLRAELAGGPRKAADVYAAAAGAGIPDRTLERAKAKLRAGSQQIKGKHGNEWWWYDPAAPWPKNAPFKKPFELPPLPPL